MVRESSEETHFSELAPYVSISDDDGSPSGSPRLSRTDPRSKSKTKGKQPVKPTRRKTRAKNSRPNSPTLVSIPKPPSTFSSGLSRPYSVGGRPTTPKDLERIRAKYNIHSFVRLRVPRKGKRPEHLHSDGVALHIDLFDLSLCLPLQLFFRKMFNDMQITFGQLSLPG